MFFIQYENTIIPSTGISKITTDKSPNGKTYINIFTSSDHIVSIFVDEPQKMLDELLTRMAEIEVKCIGNIVNFPPSNGWATVEMEKIQPEDLIIRFTEKAKEKEKNK